MRPPKASRRVCSSFSESRGGYPAGLETTLRIRKGDLTFKLLRGVGRRKYRDKKVCCEYASGSSCEGSRRNSHGRRARSGERICKRNLSLAWACAWLARKHSPTLSGNRH